MFSLQTKSAVHFGQSRVRFSSCFWRLLHIPKSETRPRHSCWKRKSWSGMKVIKYWPNPTMLLLFLSLLLWKTVAQSARSCTRPAFKLIVRSYLYERIGVEEKNRSSNWLYPLTWCSHKNDKYGSLVYQERCFHYIWKCWCYHLTSKMYSWKMNAKTTFKKSKFSLKQLWKRAIWAVLECEQSKRGCLVSQNKDWEGFTLCKYIRGQIWGRGIH